MQYEAAIMMPPQERAKKIHPATVTAALPGLFDWSRP